MAHFFVSVCGSKFRWRVAQKFIDIYIFAIVFSCCSFASAVEVGATGTSFWDWLGHAWYAGVENTLVSLIDRDTCSDSPNMNGRHNFQEMHTTVDGVTGDFYICEYCGKSAGEVLPDAYAPLRVVPSVQYYAVRN